jgi:hypothetical protein
MISPFKSPADVSPAGRVASKSSPNGKLSYRRSTHACPLPADFDDEQKFIPLIQLALRATAFATSRQTVADLIRNERGAEPFLRWGPVNSDPCLKNTQAKTVGN